MSTTNGWQEHLTKTGQLFSRVLTTEEFEIWKGIIGNLPRSALNYAFDNWQRNGRFFPKPKDILDLVAAYDLSRTPTGGPRFSEHGQGYNEGDILALWKLVSAKSIRENRKLTEAEIWELLDQIDAQRPGGAPIFRRRSA